MTAILFDSDFILSLLIAQESTHERAVSAYARVTGELQELVLPHVHYEVVGVCSRKYGQKEARMAHHFIRDRLTRVPALDEAEIWHEFFAHTKKSISYVDCANLVTARKYHWKIASFDAFYPKSLRLI